MYLDNDYIKTDNSIWGVKGNWPKSSNKILVKLVYRKDFAGNYEKVVDLPGEHGESFHWLEPSSAEHIYSRSTAGLSLLSPDSKWSLMYQALLDIGLDDNEIGYFGSKRINFSNHKDVDFIVYGMNAFNLIKQSISKIKQQIGAYNISHQHISYQIDTHAKYYDKQLSSFELCLANKWSSCMFAYRLCSTIRFVNPVEYTGELLKLILSLSGKSDKLIGIAINTDKCSFFPRQFTLLSENQEFQVVIPLWIFHQCVKEGDLVEIIGTRSDNLIVIKKYTHGIRLI